MKQKNSQKAITLIALVITIIILLILAGITIATLTGENGILSRSEQTKIDNEIATYIEKIEIAREEVAIDNLGKISIDNIINQIYKDGIVPEGSILKLNEESAKVVTPEGYVFIVTTSKVEYIGKGDEAEDIVNKLPDEIKEEDIAISLEPSELTNKNIKVTIKNNTENNYLGIQYSFDGTTWTDYQGAFEIKKNTNIYTRLRNSIGETTSVATSNVKNIDKLPPNVPTIDITSDYNFITINLSNVSDAEETSEYAKSGIKEIWYSKDKGATWQTNEEDRSKLTYNYTELEPGTTYEIQVKVIDNVGNETIKVVEEPVALRIPKLTLNKTATTIEKGKTENLQITEFPIGATSEDVIWESNDTSVVTVENGLIRAVKIGTTVVTASCGDEKVTCDVNVIAVPKLGDYVRYNSGANGIILCRVFYLPSSAYGFQLISNGCVKNVTMGGTTWATASSSHDNGPTILRNETNAYLNSSYANYCRPFGSNPNGVVSNTELVANYDIEAARSAGTLNIGVEYWVARRMSWTANGTNYWGIPYWRQDLNDCYAFSFCSNGWDGNKAWGAQTHGLRICVRLKTNVKIISGDGTAAVPYELGL